MLQIECPFCALHSESGNEGLKSRIENTVLLETDNFLVVPALGPLTVGHVLIITKRHQPSLAGVGREALKEYERLRGFISSSFQLYASNMLQGEHGGSGELTGGACITHAHVNVIPGWGHLHSILEANLVVRAQASSIIDLLNVTAPYILTRRDTEPPRVYLAKDAPSQLLRRKLCEAQGRDDWDWAVFPRYDLVRETVSLWQKQLHPRTTIH